MTQKWGLVLVLVTVGCSPATSGTGGGAGGIGGTGGAGGVGGIGGTGGGSPKCMAGAFLSSLGKARLLVGATMDDGSANAAAWDVRYLYISGGVPDGASACVSCASGCTAAGKSCKNGGVGCPWWGCYQYDQVPPGAFARDFVVAAKAKALLPMFTYYQFLQSSGATEGPAQVMKANDAVFLARYLNDWRFFLQQIGAQAAILHLEPDLWGYAQRFNPNPHAIPAKVGTANPTDCAGQEDSFAGLGKCMVAMAKKYASNAKVGLHASAWATGTDVSLNKSASFDLKAEARKVADYLRECGGADADYLAVEASDRDAGYYQLVRNENRFWDPTNATRPHFAQAFEWAKELAERLGKSLVWWQLPIGNPALPDLNQKYRDNRVDYFFGHLSEIVAAHGAVIAFGAGADDQTNPATDNGNLIGKMKAYLAGAGQAPCP